VPSHGRRRSGKLVAVRRGMDVDGDAWCFQVFGVVGGFNNRTAVE
jgi:hypothetical protein